MSLPSTQQFGLVVAYLLPGFVGLAGFAPLLPIVRDWLQPVHDGVLGFGPALYTLLAATTVSQIVNCFRWISLDQVHSWTGLKPAASDFGRLPNRVDGFDYLVQNHYRYYQFAGNMLVAVVWSYAINRLLKTSPSLGLGTDLGMMILVVVLFAASRDALAKYYHRTHRLLGGVAEKAGQNMYNGIGHHDGGSGNDKNDKKAKPETRAEPKNETPTKPTITKEPAKRPSK
jgi:hypothetical protein